MKGYDMENSEKHSEKTSAGISGKILLCLWATSLLLSCAASSQVPPPISPMPVAPLQARVLLLVPENFDRFVSIDSPRDGGVPHELGAEATDRLETLLGRYYSGVTLEVVGSEAEATDRVSAFRSGGGADRDFDLVAVPKFIRVEPWERAYKYGMDVDLQVDFYSTHRPMTTTLRGHGESSFGAYASSYPLEAGRVALDYAVSAIGDGIYASSDLRAP